MRPQPLAKGEPPAAAETTPIRPIVQAHIKLHHAQKPCYAGSIAEGQGDVKKYATIGILRRYGMGYTARSLVFCTKAKKHMTKTERGKGAHGGPNVHTAPSAAPDEHDIGLERLIFFSDAVFAIAITLLALEIRLPSDAGEMDNAALLSALLAIWPKYLSYCISFLVIGIYWLSHHRFFRFIKRYDGRLLFINLLLLLLVAFVPFPSAVIGENGNRTGTIFYALTMIAVGLLAALLWWYAAAGGRLLERPLAPAPFWRLMFRSLIAPAVFLLSIPLAFVDADLAKYAWIVIAVVVFIR